MVAELRENYQFDYSTAKPNRFSSRTGVRMFPLELVGVGTNYEFRWLDNGEPKIVNYPHYVDYSVSGVPGTVRIGFGKTTEPIFGRVRRRVIVWLDGHATAFLGADDFDSSGEVLFAMDHPGQDTMCRYPDDIPGIYRQLIPASAFVEFRRRVEASGARHAWAVAANIADHRTMILTAIARR